MSGLALTRAQATAIVHRRDLLEKEAAIVQERRQSWAGRLADLGDYGLTGGSAGDRRLIVEAMAHLERGLR